MINRESAQAATFTDAERAACARVLRALAADPGRLLDKTSADFAALAEVRGEANRLIEAVKRAVRVRRGQPPDGPPNRPGGAQAPATPAAPVTPSVASQPILSEPKRQPRQRCYACSALTEAFHRRYPQLCRECGELNLAKRTQTADLSGRRAVVTGGRVRIGYHTALKLLRAGCTVHMTTRFPCDAAARYGREPDFADWSERLTVHGLDFRHPAAVARFADALADGPLDVLVNNAAQTVRRPPAYYRRLAEAERPGPTALPRALARLVDPCDYHLAEAAEAAVGRLQTRLAVNAAGALTTRPGQGDGCSSAALSQWPLLPGDNCGGALAAALFPLPVDRTGGEPLDLRRRTSWTQTIDEVHPIEFLEVSTVNSFAPFLLLSRLLPALRRSPHPRRFVVNVSAREGRFSVSKAAAHPHTNMAKAALNMLTRTVAAGLAREGVFVNSVDPGWVSHQRPPDPAKEQTQTPPPLDAEDGAARVLDPVFTGATSPADPPHGRLWKNFHEVPW